MLTGEVPPAAAAAAAAAAGVDDRDRDIMMADDGDEDDAGGRRSPESDSDAPDDDDDEKKKLPGGGDGRCCSFLRYGGSSDAQGYSWLGAGRGAAVMSNIFLASSLLYLASEEAGCLPPSEEGGGVEDAPSCDDTKVYGFAPASLVTNIAVLSGLLSAFFMPVIGAVVDFTPHRKLVGILAAGLMTVIQIVQIGTVSSTWFAMAILQAVAGFVYQVEVVAVYAYLPDIRRSVGQATMTTFSSRFTLVQFASQTLFLVVIIALSTGLGTDSVVTAQMSQGINAVWITAAFCAGWRLMAHHDANHVLPEGHRLLTEGFKQNWKTAKSIHRNYKRGLRWFLWAVVFAEASAAAITSVSVVYLDDALGFDATQIGIFFLVTLACTLPGTQLGSFVTRRTDPNLSWRLSMIVLLLVLVVGALVLDGLPQELNSLAYIWGACVGVVLGWFYPTENLFFSMCLPPGQEAELAGFFVYCTQILAWLPPLIFTLLVEADVAQKWGVIATSFGFLVAVVLLTMAAPWDEIVLEAAGGVGKAVDEEEGGDDDELQQRASIGDDVEGKSGNYVRRIDQEAL